MDLVRGLFENRLTLILLTEKQYEKELSNLIKLVERKKAMICYVCLSNPYANVVQHLKKIGIDLRKFFFIDVLTRLNGTQKDVKNCIFLGNPGKLTAIQLAIQKVISEKNCNVVIFDTLSSLLMYQQSDNIIRFTHEMITEKQHQNVNKFFIILKEDGLLLEYNKTLIKDVGMFADDVVNA